MKIKLQTNLSNIEVTDGFEPIPAGEYVLRIDSWEQKKGDKAPYIEWVTSVQSTDYPNKKIWIRTSQSPKALELGMPDGLQALLEAVQVPWNETEDGGCEFDPDLAVGQEMIAEVEQEILSGRTKDEEDMVTNKVAKMYPSV